MKDSENYINDGDMYLEECQYHKALQVYENAENISPMPRNLPNYILKQVSVIWKFLNMRELASMMRVFTLNWLMKQPPNVCSSKAYPSRYFLIMRKLL